MMNKNESIVWVPLLAASLLLCGIYLFEQNESLFYDINSTSGLLGNFWAHVTIFGDGLLAAILMIPFLRKHHKTVWAMLWAAIVFNIILHSLKSGLNVARPPHVLPTDTFYIIGPELHHRSFPSGHTTTAVALAGVVAFTLKARWKQMALLCAGLLVGLSRIGVGVHWPTDILAGIFLGCGSAWLGWKISEKIRIGTGFVFQIIMGFLLIVAAAVWLIDYDTHYPQTDGLRYVLGAGLLVWGIVDYVGIVRKTGI